MNDDTPLVSVYIPTKNRSEKLKRALDSVIHQTYKNIEIIVIDDASSDDTQKVISEVSSSTDVRVVYIRNQSSLGGGGARNKGIQCATGRFITGLDDDDVFEINRIEEFVRQFDEKFSFLYTSYKTISENGEIKERYERVSTLSYCDALHYNRIGNQVFTLTERLQALSGFDEQLPSYQDYDLWLRLLKVYGKAKSLKNSSYIQSIGGNQDRISNDNAKLSVGRRIVKRKNLAHMNKKHKKSFLLQSYRLRRKKLGFCQFMRLVSSSNWKYAVNTYIICR